MEITLRDHNTVYNVHIREVGMDDNTDDGVTDYTTQTGNGVRDTG